jgi:peptidoglycan/LPS O-acetylase OafA/YrhL
MPSLCRGADRGKLRLESLDVLRGLAALAIVVNHWKWFYFWPAGAKDSNFDFKEFILPFGRITWLFVNYGGLAVDIFFCLSGFIFFYLYRAAIETGYVSAREFAVLRFSRLYPLHLATLLIATVLLEIYRRRYGASFESLPNDPLHFILQLFFASDWWPSPKTFNGPIWSVSIEVLLYTLFFIVAAKKLVMRVETIAAASLIGFVLLVADDDLGRGIASFFIGGLASRLVDAISARHVSRSLVAAIIVTMLAALVIVKGTGTEGFRDWFLITVAFPGLIVILVVAEKRIEWLVHPFRWLGDISYSTYLLHFPLVLVAMLLGLSRYAPSRIFFVTFLAILIALSLASFHSFEYPMQQFLRRNLLFKRVTRDTQDEGSGAP